jgi:hypothetical protein
MEAAAGGVDDMTKLSYLHEPGVLQNLAIRYELNEIYVCLFLCYIALHDHLVDALLCLFVSVSFRL